MGFYSASPNQNQGMQVTQGGLSPQEEYLRWAWNPAAVMSGSGIPLAVQGLAQMAGSRGLSGPGGGVGGFTPQFAQLVNQKLFPNVAPGFDIQNTIPQAPGPGNSLAMLNSLAGSGDPYMDEYYKRTFGR